MNGAPAHWYRPSARATAESCAAPGLSCGAPRGAASAPPGMDTAIKPARTSAPSLPADRRPELPRFMRPPSPVGPLSWECGHALRMAGRSAPSSHPPCAAGNRSGRSSGAGRSALRQRQVEIWVKARRSDQPAGNGLAFARHDDHVVREQLLMDLRPAHLPGASPASR